MQIYIVDSDYEVMKRLESLINSYPNHKARCFTTPQQLVDAVRKTPPDLAFMDIDCANGASAVKLVQSLSPGTGIIIMSGEREKASEYFRLHTGGFLIKPVEEEKLKEQLFRVSHPLLARIRYGSEGTESI